MEKSALISAYNDKINNIKEIIRNCVFLNRWYDIESSNILGEGDYGAVFLAKDKQTNLEVAIKILNPDQALFENKIYDILRNSKLKHSNIVETLDSYLNEKSNYAIIVMEKATMNLSDLLKQQKKGLKKEYLLQIFVDVLSGLDHIRSSKIISHSDIKLENIFMFNDVDRHILSDAQVLIAIEPKHIFKIADCLGFKMIGDNIDPSSNLNNGILFTEVYAAPESIQSDNKRINLLKADIYSLGLCILACCGVDREKFKPLKNINNKEIYHEQIENLLNNHDIFKNYGFKLCNLLKSMIQFDPSMRPDIQNIFETLEIIIDEYELTADNELKNMSFEENKANMESATSLFDLAVYFENGTNGYQKNSKKSVYIYKKATNLGHSEAMYNLGVCFQNGTGCEKNEKKAVQVYEKAANLGHASAMYNLGVCYQNCIGCEKNEKNAFQFYEKAANLGHSSAMYNLGLCYRNGIGCEKNENKAKELYDETAKLGHPSAMVNLGVCYQNGIGCEKNDKKAVQLYEKAANLGNSLAMYYLAIIYEFGFGCKRDLEKAYSYYKNASTLGHEKSKLKVFNWKFKKHKHNN